MKRKIRLKDIAKEFGVSVSTVSKALKNSPEIGAKTKESIQAFAKLYNYRPNTTALSLKNQNTKIIGVVIPEIIHHFFSTVINGIEKVANDKGYKVIICVSNNSLEKEIMNLGLLADGSTEGIILSVATETQQKKAYNHIEDAINQGIPIVMFDRIIKELKCDKVVIDDKASAKRAVSYLIERGCKNIGIITTPDYINVGKLRTEGYVNALIENDFSEAQQFILKVEDNDSAFFNIDNFLIHNDLDGILAVNEKFAAFAAKSLFKRQKRIPEDTSIISFTNGSISKLFVPSLTTIDQNGEEMGVNAANILIRRLERQKAKPIQEGESYYHIVQTKLIRRESVK